MKYITIDPAFFIKDGFGTLMSHYAVMYCIYRDSDFTPAILTTPNSIMTTMMHFNKNIKESILNHSDVFPNVKKIFHTIEQKELSSIKWVRVNSLSSKYESLINTIKNIQDNICLSWQLKHTLYNKYLSAIINELYIFDDIVLKKSQELLLTTTKNRVGVCVRNEYKKSNHPHISLSLNFYKHSMNQFDVKNTQYMVFSDDIEQTKESFCELEKEFDIEYIPYVQSAIGLCAMSLCGHIICANSSFSYWAALLNKNPNKKIVCSSYFIDPKKNSTLANLLNFKWYPNEWVALNIL